MQWCASACACSSWTYTLFIAGKATTATITQRVIGIWVQVYQWNQTGSICSLTCKNLELEFRDATNPYWRFDPRVSAVTCSPLAMNMGSRREDVCREIKWSRQAKNRDVREGQRIRERANQLACSWDTSPSGPCDTCPLFLKTIH